MTATSDAVRIAQLEAELENERECLRKTREALDDFRAGDPRRVRCKFKCTEVTKRTHWNPKDPGRFLYTAEFSVVIADGDENKKFFEATPSGTLKVGTFKEDHFQPGKEYFIDIVPV